MKALQPVKALQPARKFLGVGFAFPLQIDPTTGGFALAAYEADVEQAIFQILGTAKGERVMVPDFGCGMHDRVFSPNAAAQVSAVAADVRLALTRWEPRIDLLDVNVTIGGTEGEVLLIRVDYRIRANNAFYNTVYPYYVNDPQTLATQESGLATLGT
ncbi:MAG TPA: GPW/gp25 family protein [Candidatus Acidoferrales bacterium]|nr:GPW/gp25 family protein [Candidatus Acidoferrales bacterium]